MRTGTESVSECIYQDLIPPLVADKKNVDAMDGVEDMSSVVVATGRGSVHKGQDSGTASITTAGVTRTRAPGPLGQFQTCLVKPLARFLTMPYLHAQRILQLSRTVHVFHMQSTYIARQAIHLVILLNDVVDVHEGPDEEQYQERIDLGDELIELFDAMREWGANSNEGLLAGYDQCLVKINQQYAQFFRERFYFHNVRDASDDFIYGKLRAYDQKTIDFRKWQHLRAAVSIGVSLDDSVVQDHAMPSLQEHIEGTPDDAKNQLYGLANLEAKPLQERPGHSGGGDSSRGGMTSHRKRLVQILDFKRSETLVTDDYQPSSAPGRADVLSDPAGIVSVICSVSHLIIMSENNNASEPWKELRVLLSGAILLNFIGMFLLLVDLLLAGFNVTGSTSTSPTRGVKNFHQAGMAHPRSIVFKASRWSFIASSVCALISLAFCAFLDLQMLTTAVIKTMALSTPAVLLSIWVSLLARGRKARLRGRRKRVKEYAGSWDKWER